jgi:hypothetical protein
MDFRWCVNDEVYPFAENITAPFPCCYVYLEMTADCVTIDVDSADVGSANVGSADVGSADVGLADVGLADVGSALICQSARLSR